MERSIDSLMYKGSIPDAINQSRREKKLFVVYISGEDEASSNLEQSTLIDENVAKVICRFCVFLHLKQGNVDASQFSAIYPQNSIPSISVIGLNGVMLWHHEGYIISEDLKGSIEKAWATLHLQEAAATFLTASLASRNAESVNTPSTALPTQGISSTSVCPTSSDLFTGTSGVSGFGNSTDLVTQPSSTSNNEHLNLSEKECSKSDGALGGRTVEDEKPDSASTEDKTVSHDYSKCSHMGTSTNLDERDHRSIPERKDTVDETCTTIPSKSAPRTTTSRGVSLQLIVEQEKETSASIPSVLTSNPVKSNDIQLSIHMLDGRSLQTKLTKEEVLRTVKNFVDENQGGGVGLYDLAILYPRKVFTEQDMETTLCDLGFEGRQALIVVPHRRSVQVPRHQSPSYGMDSNMNTHNSGVGGYFSYLRTVLSYANPFSYLRGNPTSSNPEQLTHEGSHQYDPNSGLWNRPAMEGASRHLSGNGSQTASGSSGNTGRKQSRPFGGNIHTLRSEDEGPSDDRNVFWNGNSTEFGGDDKK